MAYSRDWRRGVATGFILGCVLAFVIWFLLALQVFND